MTLHNTQDAILQAVEAGFVAKTHVCQNEENLAYPAEIFSDPAFWQALGKARGWKQSEDRKYAFTYVKFPDGGVVTDLRPEIGESQYHALRYFETTLSGGDTQTYWQNLP